MTTTSAHDGAEWRLPWLGRVILRLRLLGVRAARGPQLDRRWVPGELLVSVPQDFGDWEAVLSRSVDRLQEMSPFRRSVARFHADEVDDADQRVIPEIRFSEPSPPRLPRRYFVLYCPPGLEPETMVVLRTMAEYLDGGRGRARLEWRRKTGSRQLRLARSAYLVPASTSGPPGPLTFTAAFSDAMSRGWLAQHPSDGAGVSVTMLDLDYPDATQLNQSIQLGRFESPEAPTDGHATLVAGAIQRLAPRIHLAAYRLREDGPASSARLLTGIVRSRSTDIIVASITLSRGDDSRAAQDHREFWAEFVDLVRNTAPRPLLIFPVGNDDGSDPDLLALPACCRGVIAIGSIDQYGRRSNGSRTNAHGSDTPEAWWMLPGGSFPDATADDCLILMDGRPQAGTSVSTALAAGMLAGLVAELRPEFEPDIRLQQLLALAADLQVEADASGDAHRAARAEDLVNAAHSLNCLSGDPVAEARSRSSAVPPLADYDPTKWGEGVLHVLP